MLWWILAAVAALTALMAAAVKYFVGFAVERNGMKEMPTGDDPTWGKFAPEILAGEKIVAEWDVQDVEITARDGVTLHAAWYPAVDARATVVLMHGFRGKALRDFCWIMPFYRSLGMNVLLPDQRAHGKSGGEHLTFGVKERFDCADWLQWLDEHVLPRKPVFLNGVSMGGATVLMASGVPLAGDVRGIIADCGYTSPDEIMRHVCRSMFHLPTFPLFNLCAGVICRRAGFHLTECSTLDAMAVNKTPILFIHGTADTFVPPEMTKRNYAACRAEKELVLVEGATHAVSCLVDAPRCQAAITAFIERNLER